MQCVSFALSLLACCFDSFSAVSVCLNLPVVMDARLDRLEAMMLELKEAQMKETQRSQETYSFMRYLIQNEKKIMSQEEGSSIRDEERSEGGEGERVSGDLDERGGEVSGTEDNDNMQVAEEVIVEGDQNDHCYVGRGIEVVAQDEGEGLSYDELIAKYDKVEVMAPAVNAKLAEFINKAMTSRLDPKTYKAILDKYQQPENTQFLVVPRVNRTLWTSLDKKPHVQNTDKDFQNLQKEFLKGMLPLVQAIDAVPEGSKAWSCLNDSFRIFARQMMIINDKRRAYLKAGTNLSNRLFDHDIPVSTWLMGDNFDEEVKSLDDDKKIRDAMAQAAHRRYDPSLRKGTGGPMRKNRERQDKPYGHTSTYQNKPYASLSSKVQSFLGEGGSNPPQRPQQNRQNPRHFQRHQQRQFPRQFPPQQTSQVRRK